MQNTPRYIDINPCDNNWNEMQLDKTGDKRFCSSCSEFVHDLTQVDLLGVNQNELKGKCININDNQLQDLMFVHPLKRFATALFLVFGSALFVIPNSFAQEVEGHYESNEVITIKGIVVNEKGKPLRGIKVTLLHIVNSDMRIKTNTKGEFVLEFNKEDLNKENRIRISLGKKEQVKSIYLTSEQIQDVGTVIYYKNIKKIRRGKALAGRFSDY